MSSAPIYAMVLEKEDAVQSWRNLMGPTNSNKARETDPNSIRALFGKDGSHNAAHGSDSLESAEREIDIIFSNENHQVVEDSSLDDKVPREQTEIMDGQTPQENTLDETTVLNDLNKNELLEEAKITEPSTTKNIDSVSFEKEACDKTSTTAAIIAESPKTENSVEGTSKVDSTIINENNLENFLITEQVNKQGQQTCNPEVDNQTKTDLDETEDSNNVMNDTTAKLDNVNNNDIQNSVAPSDENNTIAETNVISSPHGTSETAQETASELSSSVTEKEEASAKDSIVLQAEITINTPVSLEESAIVASSTEDEHKKDGSNENSVTDHITESAGTNADDKRVDIISFDTDSNASADKASHITSTAEETSTSDVSKSVDKDKSPLIEETLVSEPIIEKHEVEEHEVEKNEIKECESEEREVTESTAEEYIVEECKIEEPALKETKIKEPTVEEHEVGDHTTDDALVEDALVEDRTIKDSSVVETTIEDPPTNEAVIEESIVYESAVKEFIVTDSTEEELGLEKPNVEELTVEEKVLNKSVFDESMMLKTSVEDSTSEESTVTEAIEKKEDIVEEETVSISVNDIEEEKTFIDNIETIIIEDTGVDEEQQNTEHSSNENANITDSSGPNDALIIDTDNKNTKDDEPSTNTTLEVSTEAAEDPTTKEIVESKGISEEANVAEEAKIEETMIEDIKEEETKKEETLVHDNQDNETSYDDTASIDVDMQAQVVDTKLVNEEETSSEKDVPLENSGESNHDVVIEATATSQECSKLGESETILLQDENEAKEDNYSENTESSASAKPDSVSSLSNSLNESLTLSSKSAADSTQHENDVMHCIIWNCIRRCSNSQSLDRYF
ncbi:MAG: hypothetical protein EXX96DRAFT_163221 [Benjaminiella poitrasii]|nr:MAG: hypothetical protein EXX96DRAFT_163221 [Benjaminiella poitrasii]